MARLSSTPVTITEDINDPNSALVEHVIQRVRASFGETEVENETDEAQAEMANDIPKVQTNASPPPQDVIYAIQDKNDTAEANVNRFLKIQKMIRNIIDILSCW
ncbi:hypothetical protein RMATCC62417_06432 [Rhizopus microsporus]|nr:hypothetical protein RMATCC62417_06432 [Rhizopus microsporus]